MKKLLLSLLCATCLVINAPLVAQESSIVVNQSEDHSIFEGLFRSVWAKLKSINPTAKQSARSVQFYTAGIRGAESTDTLLTPYWKDDLTQDEQFQAQLEKFVAEKRGVSVYHLAQQQFGAGVDDFNAHG